MGGAGVAAPALIWSLIRPVTFFFGGMLNFRSVLWADAVGDDPVASPGPQRSGDPRDQSDLGDLAERQLDRGLPAEDGDEHLELLVLGADLRDRRRQGVEGAVGHGDRLADGEVDLDLRGGLGGARSRG